jgi:predicted MFS family arabinose efflux permease
MTREGRRLSRAFSSGRSWGYRNRALFLLFMALVLDYADRTLVGALGPTLKQAFGIGDFRLGLLASLFLFVGALATIPMGTLLDRRDRTLLLSGSFVVWSIAIGVAGAAATFAVLLGARLLLGVASAAYGPASPSLVGDLVPVGKRGWALGVVDGGLLVGLALGYLLPAVITAFASWRLCFWVLAMAGFATAYGFARLKEPERGHVMGPADEDELGGSGLQRMVKQRGVRPSRGAILREEPRRMTMWEAAKYVVRVRTDLITVLGRALGDSFLQGVATFMVVFVTGWYGLSQEGAYAGILGVGVGAIAGVLILGRTSDALLGRGWLHGRILVGALANFAAAVAFFAAFSTRSFAVAVPLFAVGAFFVAGSEPVLDAVRVDVLVGELRGRAEAIKQVVTSLLQGLAPVAIGGISVAFGGGAQGLQFALLIGLSALFLNGIIMLLALRTYQPDVAAAIASTEGEEAWRPE